MIDKGLTMDKIRSEINEFIETYIQEKIIYAQQQMVTYGEDLFNKKKHETIMVLGCSMVFDELFKAMVEKGTQFTVIVVDTSPSFQGRALLQRLSNYGVSCKYTLINGISCLLPSTTKVFIDAYYVLGNGGVVGTMGTSMVAYLASQYKVPVIAWCETYKFTQRVNLDQIKNN